MLTKRAGVGADSIVDPAPAVESAPTLESALYLESLPSMGMRKSGTMSLHHQFSVKFFYSYGYHGKTKFIKQHLYWFHTRFSVPNPPIEPIPVMEPAPTIPKQMSQCRNRGCRKAWNHTPIPIPESESHHP